MNLDKKANQLKTKIQTCENNVKRYRFQIKNNQEVKNSLYDSISDLKVSSEITGKAIIEIEDINASNKALEGKIKHQDNRLINLWEESHKLSIAKINTHG